MIGDRPRTVDAARGKWRGILQELGVPAEALRNRHGPCPVCGGTDRFRFDNREGAGTWICNVCGAGDGMALAMAVTGLGFKETAARIDAILGAGPIRAEKPAASGPTPDEARARMRALWDAAVPARPGDLVDTYLRSRDLDEASYPPSLRFHRAANDGEGGVRPAMLAKVVDPTGRPVTIHRTFLRPDGLAKAEMGAPRKLMPMGADVQMPDGSCVRLSGWVGGPLGIAEGVETAMAAANRFELPVWAALNTALLKRWLPPEGVTEVVVFADHDPGFAGQAAAYELARRLAAKGVAVEVVVPPERGTDWADIWKGVGECQSSLVATHEPDRSGRGLGAR